MERRSIFSRTYKTLPFLSQHPICRQPFCLTPCLFHTIFVSHPFCPTPIWSTLFLSCTLLYWWDKKGVGQKVCRQIGCWDKNGVDKLGAGTKRVLTNGVLGQKGCRTIVCWDIRCVDKLIWDKLCVCPLRSSKGL